MQYLKRALSAGLVLVTILAATISSTSTASAAPSGLNCPSEVGAGLTITCTFTFTGSSSVLGTTESNSAASVTSLRVSGTSGTITVRGNSPGGVTVCVTDGSFQTCDSIEVFDFT